VRRARSAAALLLVAVCALVAAGVSGCVSSARDRQVATEYFDLGNAYVELGRYEKAVTAFQSAVQLDPSFVKAQYNLALAYVRVKRTDDAVVILKRLLSSDPQNTQVLSALGWSYHLAGREEDALAQYSTVTSLSPADQNALYNSAIILWKLSRLHDAMDKLGLLLSRAPEDTDALFAAGSILLALDQPSDSADMLSRYLDKKPKDTEAWFMVAAGAERIKKYTRALEAYGKIETIDQTLADAWFGEARLLLTVVEDPQHGLDSLNKALSAGFKDTKAIQALLDSPGLLERDKVEDALKGKGLLPAPAESAAPAPAPGSAPASTAPASTPAASPPAPQK